MAMLADDEVAVALLPYCEQLLREAWDDAVH